ncbi:exodeoxyribonuclease VII small subunit [Varunaivibrio sulfuroxidans]|uniref:Exodeoxyribonuclease 7 small subunit n=1 Tax=Varunaivibrio sulfuroxidans TaxID=1773489 RepID=A0A4V2UN19_9PROT|nr:exodeoxyribonuclease VII small subunit [Varunaivibrio sulfuroxidans]TCS60351.1 exodeoxyribonuclease VII small subunit [Varunaivibrio sulfuroxidans]WES30962.1 exodeoxyribonuclease VII small subunit [Varunaivibrio sulfuroxidans]
MSEQKEADNSEAQDISQMNFEDALGELETIVRQLEEGRGGLDASISAYERGAELKRHCEAKLQEAEARIEKIIPGAGGVLKTEPLDVE